MKQVLLSIFLTGALSGVLLAQTPAPAPKAAPTAPKAAPKAPAAAANLLSPATLNRTAPATYRVKLTTTKGDVIIDVTRDWAPRGADRFYNLVRSGYFTDVSFFRVVPDFMAPTTNKLGIEPERPAKRLCCRYPRGGGTPEFSIVLSVRASTTRSPAAS